MNLKHPWSSVCTSHEFCLDTKQNRTVRQPWMESDAHWHPTLEARSTALGHSGAFDGTALAASPASIWHINKAITPPSVLLPSPPPITSVLGINGTLLLERASTAFTSAVALAPKAATCLS